MKKLLPLLVVAAGIAIYWFLNLPPSELVLTGIVTTHEVVVSPQIAGRIDRLLVNEGDVVAKGQLLAVLAPDELRAGARVLRARAPKAPASQVARAKRRCASSSGRSPNRSRRPRRRWPRPSRSGARRRGRAAQARASSYERAQRDVEETASARPQQLDRRAPPSKWRSRGSRRRSPSRSTRSARPCSWPAPAAEQIAMRRSQLAATRSSRPRPPRSSAQGRRAPGLHRAARADRRHRRRPRRARRARSSTPASRW